MDFLEFSKICKDIKKNMYDTEIFTDCDKYLIMYTYKDYSVVVVCTEDLETVDKNGEAGPDTTYSVFNNKGEEIIHYDFDNLFYEVIYIFFDKFYNIEN